jgi:glycosyltransferase involved in cell wall biosynthesis
MDVLIIYQFCTFGGVERVILNRTKVFKKHSQNVRISVGYLYDQGALQSFQAYIRAHDLDDYLVPFILPANFSLEGRNYDYIFVIDTPQVLERTSRAGNLFIECHTPYWENRQYLKNIPPNIQGILVPSEAFRTLLASEFPALPPISVLPNPVSDEFFENQPPNHTRIFTRRPITYFARVEDIKNASEAIQIFELFAEDTNVVYFIIGKGAGQKSLIRSLEHKGLIERALLRDQVEFDDVPSLVNLVKDHRGVFLSPSKGESFGLSAAEFISSGVPVLLSDIPPHRDLVENDERFLYSLGDTHSAREKLVKLLLRWDAMSETVKKYGNKFRGDVFMKAWNDLLFNRNRSDGPWF